MVKVKGHTGPGHIGQDQILVRIPNKGRWAHINVKLLHFMAQNINLFEFDGGVSI